jgi:hypothetical protein
MPNWIGNEVFVTGDADTARGLRAFMTTPQSKFDFNAVLPMPDEIRTSESSSKAETAWQLKYGDWTENRYDYGPGQFATRDDALAAARAADAWRPMAVVSPGGSLPVIQPRSFDELADLVQSLVVKYGFPDWYEWACATWGTKWPAVDAGWMGPARAAKRDAHQVAFFQTAWSPPVPVIVELSARFPDVIVRLSYSESDPYGGVYGFVTVEAGNVIGEHRGEWDCSTSSICTDHRFERSEHEEYVYIGHGRPAAGDWPILPRSPWANPFAGCHCSPEESVSRYRRWLEGDAEVVKLLPSGEWPVPDVFAIQSTFLGKTILCDCTPAKGGERPGCHARVLIDLAFGHDGEPESLDDDECDAPATRGCDGVVADAAGLVARKQAGD